MENLALTPGTHLSRLSHGGYSLAVQRHASVGDALRHACARKAWPTNLCSSLRVDDPGFHGTSSWEEALGLAWHGWAEGRNLLRRASAAMPRAVLRDRITRWEVAGAYPDPARAAAGAPDCMVDDGPEEPRPSQSIRLIASISTPWTTPLREFANRGAAILSAAEAAEAQGHRIEIVVEETSAAWQRGLSASILLKAAGHPADRDSLAFFLIHPSSLRRIFFALMETEADLRPLSSGYGVPMDQPAELRGPGTIYLGHFHTGQFATPELALTRVRQAFAAAGCEVEFDDGRTSTCADHPF